MIVGCCTREEIEPFHYTRDEMAHLVHVVFRISMLVSLNAHYKNIFKFTLKGGGNLFKITVILHKSLT